jgi:hypothetical protein
MGSIPRRGLVTARLNSMLTAALSTAAMAARRVIPRPAIDVWEYAAEEYQRDAGGAVATSGNTIAPSECPTNTASSRSAGYDESTTSA